MSTPLGSRFPSRLFFTTYFLEPLVTIPNNKVLKNISYHFEFTKFTTHDRKGFRTMVAISSTRTYAFSPISQINAFHFPNDFVNFGLVTSSSAQRLAKQCYDQGNHHSDKER